MTHTGRVVLPFLCLLLASAPARAERGEHQLSLGGEYVKTDLHGGGLGLWWAYGINDWWAVTAGGAWSMHPDQDGAPGHHRVLTGAGVVFNIDAFEWIPYLLLTVGSVHRLDDIGAVHAFGLQVGGGLDWRPKRRFALGIYGTYQLAAREGAADSLVAAGFRVSLFLE